MYSRFQNFTAIVLLFSLALQSCTSKTKLNYTPQERSTKQAHKKRLLQGGSQNKEAQPVSLSVSSNCNVMLQSSCVSNLQLDAQDELQQKQSYQERVTYTTPKGDRVEFIKKDNQWYAEVDYLLPEGYSKKDYLPIACRGNITQRLADPNTMAIIEQGNVCLLDCKPGLLGGGCMQVLKEFPRRNAGRQYITKSLRLIKPPAGQMARSRPYATASANSQGNGGSSYNYKWEGWVQTGITAILGLGAIYVGSEIPKEVAFIEELQSTESSLAVMSAKGQFAIQDMQKMEYILNFIQHNKKAKNYFLGREEVLGSEVSQATIANLLDCFNKFAANYMAHYGNKGHSEGLREKMKVVNQAIWQALRRSKSIAPLYIYKAFEDDFGTEEFPNTDQQKEDVYNLLRNEGRQFGELYIRFLYLMGRTYLYEDPNSGLKYFEWTAYLGKEMNTFEYILSKRHGIGVIDRCSIDKELKAIFAPGPAPLNPEKLIDLHAKLEKVVQQYKKLKADKGRYKYDYSMYRQEQTIIPSEDAKHTFQCDEALILNYALLIRLLKEINTDNTKNDQMKELHADLLALLKASPTIGSLNELLTNEKLRKVSSKLEPKQEQQLSALVTLASLLLLLGDSSTNTLEKTIAKSINYPIKNLERNKLIEHMLKEVLDLCFNETWSKVNAYAGLYFLYQIEANNLAKDMQEECEKVLKFFNVEDPHINIIAAVHRLKPIFGKK
jgi:hypothetical protein